MFKRITAILLATLLVLSAFLMTSCKKDKEEGEDEEKIVVENLSAKELFALSINNTLSGGNGLMSAFTTSSKNEGEISAKVNLNKLEVEGNDMLQGEKISAEIGGKVDMDNKAVEVQVALNALGEKPSFKGVLDTNGVYITDLLGVNSQPIGMTFEDLDLDASVLDQILNNEFIDASAELYNDIAKALSASLDKNITESAYTKEMKDVTVDGKEYKGAAVATLTVTSEMAKNFVYDFITSLSANDVVSDLLNNSGMDASDISDEIDFEGSVKITNIVSADAKTIAVDFDVDIEGKKFALKYSNIETSIKMTAGLVGENGEFDVDEGIIKFEYTLDGENEKATLTAVEGEETMVLMTIEGTLKNGKHEGTLKINPEQPSNKEEVESDGAVSAVVSRAITVKYTYEATNTTLKLGISEIGMVQNGITVSIPLNLSYELKATGSKFEYKIAAALNMENTINVDFSLEVAVDLKSVTVTAPTSYMTIDELDENTAQQWLTKLQNKYPKIIEFISEMGNSSNTDTVRPSVGFDEF